ncbi:MULTISPECIES: TolC family protein [Spirosoma]|uniref:TolC family protein n=1 Tax=Spirosoma sordidisoli TaxID=2502893 RepID=A0A4Q2URD9_9BACT|nr:MULTISPECIES: TolC family protein [Spirosoma]RYC72114.1 TolC family protein [Spirosoma sordidisoli]
MPHAARLLTIWMCAISGLVGLPTRLQAQQRLTLEEAVAATLAQYPTLAARQSALGALRANSQILADNRLPNVRVHSQTNIGTANGLSGSYFSLGLIVPTSGARRADNQADLATGNIALASADWEVYNFGRFAAENQLLRADIAVGEAGLERERFGLRQTVISSFLDLFWTEQNLQIEQRNLARVDTVHRIIANLVRNGIKPGLDSSLARAALSRARLAYLRMQEERQRARVQLATLTGRPIDQIEIDTALRVDPLLIPLADPEPVSAHPLLQVQQRLITRQVAEVDLIRKSALPRVTLLGATWARGSSLDVDNNYGPLLPGLSYSRTNYLLGVAATANLMDFRRATSRVRLQQFRVEEARNQLMVAQLQLQNTLGIANARLAVVQNQLAELPNALRSAREAYTQRLSLYNNGLETVLSLTDALTLLTAVEKEVVQTRAQAVQLRLQRAQATDNLDEFYSLFRR